MISLFLVSERATIAVPNLPTAMPAASLASSTEDTKSSFLAIPDAMYETTVSPAPDTSKTSCAFEGIWKLCPSFLITDIPSEPLVVITDLKP